MLKKIVSISLLSFFPWIAYAQTETAPLSSFFVEKTQEKKGVSEKIQETKEVVSRFAKADEDVLSQFNLFCQSLEKGVSGGKISEKGALVVLDAVAYAAEKHQLQARSNAKKTPYIIHPIEVADLVMRVGQSYEEEVIIAALLHDVIEDTSSSFEEIADRYGKTVSNYVKEMTDPKGVPLKERKKLQIINAFHQTPGAAIIKMSDKLSNLSVLSKNPPSNWSRDRIDQYFQWAQSVVENLPNANPSLKTAVKDVIADYWQKQNQKKSN